MIKYNENNINEWYFSDDNIVKVYRNEDVIYQKIASGSTPPTLGNDAFYNTDCPIYVMLESVAAYKTAWSAYADRIQAITDD